MGVRTITAWFCDFPTCGHVWYTAKEPLRCSKCKRKNWNKTAGTVIKAPRRKKPVGKVTAKPVISQIEKPKLSPEVEQSAAPGWEKPAAPVLETIVHAPTAERFQEALKQIAEPKHNIGEKCKHGWANWLQCDKCNPKVNQ